MGKTKYLSAFEQGMVVGARRTNLSVSRTATLLGFYAQQFPVCIKNGPPQKGHPATLTQLRDTLESTWASIPVECFQHLVESMPKQIEVVLRAKDLVQLNVRKVFMYDIQWLAKVITPLGIFRFFCLTTWN